MKLCERILRLRTERGMSQEELAAYLDVSRQSVSKWETGTSVPELDKLMKLRELFGVTLDDLVCEKEPIEKKPEREQMPVVREVIPGRKIVGAVLFAISLLSLYFLPASAVLLFAVLGVCCFLITERTWLVGAWILFLYFDGLYAIYDSTVYYRLRILVGLGAVILILWTVFSFRRMTLALSYRRTLMWMSALTLALVVIVPLIGEGFDTLSAEICAALRAKNGGNVAYHSDDYANYYAWTRFGRWAGVFCTHLREICSAGLATLFTLSTRAVWKEYWDERFRLPVLSARVRVYLGAGLLLAVFLIVTVLCVISIDGGVDEVILMLLQGLLATLPISLCGAVLLCVKRHALLAAAWTFWGSSMIWFPFGSARGAVLVIGIFLYLLAGIRLTVHTYVGAEKRRQKISCP